MLKYIQRSSLNLSMLSAPNNIDFLIRLIILSFICSNATNSPISSKYTPSTTCREVNTTTPNFFSEALRSTTYPKWIALNRSSAKYI